jgi:hypothetical protein
MVERQEIQSVEELIEWGPVPEFMDSELWNRNCNIVRMLCGKKGGEVTEWAIDIKGSYKIPRKYKIDGVEVEFLPTWGVYFVAGQLLDKPTSLEDLDRDVKAFQYLLSRGYKRSQSS